MAQAARLEERGRAVAVPDLDALGGEEGRVCRAADEPEQLLDDAAQEGALGGEEGEGVVCQGKSQGRGREEGEGARARAVGSRRAGVEDASDEIQVLLLFVYSGHGRRKKKIFRRVASRVTVTHLLSLHRRKYSLTFLPRISFDKQALRILDLSKQKFTFVTQVRVQESLKNLWLARRRWRRLQMGAGRVRRIPSKKLPTPAAFGRRQPAGLHRGTRGRQPRHPLRGQRPTQLRIQRCWPAFVEASMYDLTHREAPPHNGGGAGRRLFFRKRNCAVCPIASHSGRPSGIHKLSAPLLARLGLMLNCNKLLRTARRGGDAFTWVAVYEAHTAEFLPHRRYHLLQSR